MNKRLLYWTFQIGGWSVYATINILFLIWAFLVAQLEPGRTANPLGILPPMARILFVYGWLGIPKEKGFFDSQKPQNIPGIICGFRPGVVVI